MAIESATMRARPCAVNQLWLTLAVIPSESRNPSLYLINNEEVSLSLDMGALNYLH
jgi:hypothetical protein